MSDGLGWIRVHCVIARLFLGAYNLNQQLAQQIQNNGPTKCFFHLLIVVVLFFDDKTAEVDWYNHR
ncbi:hypothetical protein TMU01_06750 [Tenuibacillus multivorans]|nr:hypothetical protein TMU01_06750 [Tenuibacillus multivorans]